MIIGKMGAACDGPGNMHFDCSIVRPSVKGFPAEKCLLTFQDDFRLCGLCGYETRNNAQFEVSSGRYDEKLLHVCRWCLQDLQMLGFELNQVLPFRTRRSHKVACLPAVLGTCFDAPMEAICYGK